MKTKYLLLSLGVALCVLGGLLFGLHGPPPEVAANGTVRYVSPDGTDTPFCATKTSPCRTVQYAIGQAQDGDTIRVATGVYTATGAPVADVDKSLTLSGGWDPDFNLLEPNPDAYTTTLDGRGLNRVVNIDAGSYVTVTVQGFEITGGDATGGARWGGGLYANQAKLYLLDNLIWNNFASSGPDQGWGGGAYLNSLSSSSLISNNVIYSNTAAVENVGYGGGLRISSAATGVRLVNNQLLTNTASITSGGGGGLAVFGSVITVTGNLFQGNAASVDGHGLGGGLWSSNSEAWIEDNVVVGNRATTVGGPYLGYGGGLYAQYTDVVLYQNEISQNRTGGGPAYGGGVAIMGGNHLTVTKNLVTQNQAGEFSGEGGGLYLDGPQAGVIARNRVLDNDAASGMSGEGGGVMLKSGTFTVTNNFFAANSAAESAGILAAGESTAEDVRVRLDHNTVADHVGYGVEVGDFADLEGHNNLFADNTVGITLTGSSLGYQLTHRGALFWPDADGSVSEASSQIGDPAFVDAANYDYHLTAASAAIDEVPLVWEVTDIDIDGQARPYDGSSDIGADEYPPDVAMTFVSDETGSAQANHDAIYTHRLTNTGRITDTYEIYATIDDPTWNVEVSPESTAVEPGEGLDVQVIVTVDSEADYGDSAQATITATSQVDTEVWDTVVDTTTVACTPPSGFDFIWTPDAPVVGEMIDFRANPGSGSTPFTYDWAFDDGDGAQGQDVSHKYNSSGIYTVYLTVTNPCDVQVVTHDVTVTEPPSYGVDLMPETQSREVDAGSTTVYTETLHNTGNVADTFTVTVNSSEGWATLLSPDTVTVGPDNTVEVEVQVSVPGGAVSGTLDTTTVEAISSGDPTERDRARLRTTAQEPPVPPTYGADLTPATQSRDVYAGSSTLYVETLENTGNVADTFTVTVDSTRGWTTLNSKATVNLAPGVGTEIEVRALVPGTAGGGVEDVATVMATSWASPTVEAQATLTTIAASAYGADLSPAAQSREVEAGTTAVYTETLENTGNLADTFTVTISSTQGWATLLSPATVNLAPDAAAEIEVQITVPDTADSGAEDVTTVTAISSGGPTAEDQATLTTTVADRKIYLPLVMRNG